MKSTTTPRLRAIAFAGAVLLLALALFTVLPPTAAKADSGNLSPRQGRLLRYTPAGSSNGTLTIEFDGAMANVCGVSRTDPVLLFTPLDEASPNVITLTGTKLFNGGTWASPSGIMYAQLDISLARAGISLVAGTAYQVSLVGGQLKDDQGLLLAAQDLGTHYFSSVTGLLPAEDTLPCNGGELTVTVEGGGLSSDIEVGLFDSGGSLVTQGTADAGNSKLRTAALTVPPNNTTTAVVYSLQYRDTQLTTGWQTTPATVTVADINSPVVRSVQPGVGEIPAAGGEVMITVGGGGPLGGVRAGLVNLAGGETAPQPQHEVAMPATGDAYQRSAGVTVLPNPTTQAITFTAVYYHAPSASWRQVADVHTVVQAGAMEVTGLAVSPNALPAAGGDRQVTVSLTGVNLLNTGIEVGLLAEGETAPATAHRATVDGGTQTGRSAGVALAPNTHTQPLTYTAVYSTDGGATWQGVAGATATVEVAAYVPPPVPDVSAITLDPVSITATARGPVHCTVVGSHMPATITLGIFTTSSASATPVSTVSAAAQPGTASAELFFPKNTKTAEKRYYVRASLDAGESWSACSATLVVAGKPVRYTGGSMDTSHPGTGSQIPPQGISAGLWTDDGGHALPMLTLSGASGEMSNVILTSQVGFGKFAHRVEWNGSGLDKEAFSAASGSTVVTLHAQFLRTQPNGTHRVRVLFTDGYEDFVLQLNISGAQAGETTTGFASPQTGDPGAGLPFFGALALLSLGGLAAALCARRRVSRG